MAQPLTRTGPRIAPSLSEAAEAARYAAVAGRFLLSLIFVLAGIMKIVNWQTTAEQMAGKGIPMVHAALAVAAVVEIAGGLSVLLGCWARLGALALFVFLIPTTVIFHNFWTYEGTEMLNQMQHFQKNLAIMGGLLLVTAFGSGPLSVDGGVDDLRRRGPLTG